MLGTVDRHKTTVVYYGYAYITHMQRYGKLMNSLKYTVFAIEFHHSILLSCAKTESASHTLSCTEKNWNVLLV